MEINHSAGRPFGGLCKKNVPADRSVPLYVCSFFSFAFGLLVTKKEIGRTYTAHKETRSA